MTNEQFLDEVFEFLDTKLGMYGMVLSVWYTSGEVEFFEKDYSGWSYTKKSPLFSKQYPVPFPDNIKTLVMKDMYQFLKIRNSPLYKVMKED